jgi:hypothetical protein
MLRISNLAFVSLLVLLSACGRPDTLAPTVPATPTAAPAMSQDIANLLRDPPAANTPVELDVYNWVGQERQAGYGWDEQHCPRLTDVSLLTDQPIAEWIGLPNGGHTNWSREYPPDTATWLIPMFAGMIPYPVPSTSAPLPHHLGYHLRVRGHLGDAYFAHCAKSSRIFVIDAVVKVYQEAATYYGIMGGTKAPADYKQWNRHAARAQGVSFPARADWKITSVADPHASAALEIRLPQQPEYPVTVRVYNGAPTQEMLKGNSGAQFEYAMLLRQVGLPVTGDPVTPYGVLNVLDAHTSSYSVIFTKNNKTYEIALTYPVGFYADPDLLETYIGIVAGFQIDG